MRKFTHKIMFILTMCAFLLSFSSYAATAVSIGIVKNTPIIVFRAEAVTKEQAIENAISVCREHYKQSNQLADCSKATGTEYRGYWTFSFSRSKMRIGIGFDPDLHQSNELALSECTKYTGNRSECITDNDHLKTWAVSGN